MLYGSTMLCVPQIEDTWSQRGDHFTGSRKKAEECFQKGSKIADAQMAVVELQEYKKNADPSDLLRAKKPAMDSAFHSSSEKSQFTFTRRIPMLLRLTFQRHSTPNRKKRSPSSSVRTGTSLHGNPLTCQVYPGDWLSIVYVSTPR